MKLGIFVNTNRHARHLIGLTRAAVSQGHDVTLFIMDSGVRLLSDSGLHDLAGLDNVLITFCAQSAKKHGVDTKDIPPVIIAGSQMNNAIMCHNADKVIVL